MRKSLLAMTLTVVLILTLLSVSIVSLTGCTETECTSTEDENDCPFVTIYEEYSYKIVYHKDTKVMYTVSDGSENRGNFTVLVDKDGKPMLYEEKMK